jgi:hypothetical protein
MEEGKTQAYGSDNIEPNNYDIRPEVNLSKKLGLGTVKTGNEETQ